VIVNVPFPQIMVVRLPRKMKDIEASIPDTHPVEIKEVTGAPVVARIPPHKDRETWLDLRYWENRFWIPAHQSFQGRNQPCLGLNDIKEGLESEGVIPGAYLARQDVPWTVKQFASLEEMAPKLVRVSNRDDKIVKIEENARNCLIIDGILHKLTSEPVMQLRKYVGSACISYDTLDALHWKDGAEGLWRLDETDTILGILQEEGLRLEGHEVPEVVIPDLLHWDHYREVFWASVGVELRTYASRSFAEASLENFALYVTARDAYRAADRTSDDDVTRVGDAVMNLKEHLLSHENETWSFRDTEEAYDAFLKHRRLGIYDIGMVF